MWRGIRYIDSALLWKQLGENAQENMHHVNRTTTMTLSTLTAFPLCQNQCQNANNSIKLIFVLWGAHFTMGLWEKKKKYSYINISWFVSTDNTLVLQKEKLKKTGDSVQGLSLDYIYSSSSPTGRFSSSLQTWVSLVFWWHDQNWD